MFKYLPNLGPKSASLLETTGITSIEQLRSLGSVQAYLLVKQHEPGVSLNLLWALEGALSNRTWQEVARHDRLSLLLQLEALEGRA